MKRKNLIFVMLLVLSALLTIQSCKKESPVGFTEEQAFTIPTLIAPNQGFLNVTGPTIDLKWESTNAAGAPNNWAVYFGTGDDPALLQTGVTTETVTVPVVPGKKYNWKVIGTDANGLTTAGPVWSFETVDPAAALDVKMSWTTDVKSVVGLDLAPDAAVNLRLLILKADKSTLAVPVINTKTFEEFPGFSSLADGVYYVATDLASSINAGDFNKTFNISIDLAFSQRGIFNDQLAFPTVMTTDFPCSDYRTILAKVTKTGNTFTAEQSVSKVTPPPPAALAGTWHGLDDGFVSHIVTNIADGNLLIDKVGLEWMFTDWGEVVITTTPANVVFNSCSGTLSIPQQEFMTTTYLGAPQPAYSIVGTGTFDLSGAFPVMNLSYDFIQVDGAGSIAKQLGLTHFTATLTQDPSAKSLMVKGAKSTFVINKTSFK
jgi:hypothetical protein